MIEIRYVKQKKKTTTIGDNGSIICYNMLMCIELYIYYYFCYICQKMLMNDSPQFKLYSDLDAEIRARNAPTDRMPTVQISAMMQERMSRQYKLVVHDKKHIVYNEYDMLRRDIRKARMRQDVSIVAWTPFLVFFAVVLIDVVVLLWPERGYVLLMLYNWLSR